MLLERPNKDDAENIQVLIDMGAHIFSGGGEEKGTVGRKMTNRQMPVGDLSHFRNWSSKHRTSTQYANVAQW
ncbi:MAG: hypothetical protein CM1200mP39_27080 [Dehalococcoidia bacterium]|nr:MAG: hypothetical protein CM1200mP39_27080 [Dehalococcoidia bacterium]